MRSYGDDQLGLRIGGNGSADEIQLFEQGFEEPRQVHGIELTAIAGQLCLDGVLEDAAGASDVVAAEGASAKGDGGAGAS